MTQPSGSDNAPALSVIILCYREEGYVPTILAAVEAEVRQLGIPYEIILVANYVEGTNDRSPHIASTLVRPDGSIRVVAKPKEGMMGWDMRTGLEAARGRLLAVLDGDGQVPSGDILRVYQALREGRFDLCQTYRVTREDGWSRTLLSRAYNRAFRLLFPGVPLHDVNAKPKIMTREAYRAMRLTSNDWFIDAEIILQARRYGLRIGEIPSRFERGHGRPSFISVKAVLEFLKNLAVFRVRETRARRAPRAPLSASEPAIFDAVAPAYEQHLSRSVRWSGERADYFARYKLARIQAMVGAHPPTHVLDVGCGVGLLTELLGRAFPSSRITGVDLSGDSLNEAVWRCAGLSNVTLRRSSGNELPPEVQGVTLAVLANVLHHLEPEARRTFLEQAVLPALAPEGRVVVFEHNPYNPLTRLVVKGCPFDEDARLLSLRSAVALLRGSGLDVIERAYTVFFPRPLSVFRGLEGRLGRLPLGAQYMVVGEQPARSGGRSVEEVRWSSA